MRNSNSIEIVTPEYLREIVREVIVEEVPKRSLRELQEKITTPEKKLPSEHGSPCRP